MGVAAQKLGEEAVHGFQILRNASRDEGKEGQRVRRNLRVALYSILAVIFFKFTMGLISSPILKVVALITLLGFSILLFAFLASDLFRSVCVSFRHKRLPVELCTFVVLFLVSVPLVSGLMNEILDSSSTTLSLAPLETFLTLLFIIAFERQMRVSFRREMEAAALADPAITQGKIRKITIEVPEIDSEKKQFQLNLGEGQERVSEVDATELKVGDLFRLSKGATVPCESIIRSGSCQVLERNPLGWGDPKARIAGTRLQAGSEIVFGDVLCEVLQEYRDSVYQQLLGDLRKNQDADSTSNYYTAIIFALVMVAAYGAAFYWQGRGESLAFICNIVAAILLVTILAANFSLFALQRRAVFGAAFVKGIFLNSFTAFEKLAKLKKLIIDYDERNPLGQESVVKFELVDTRIDEATLAKILFSFFGRSDSETNIAIASYLREHFDVGTGFELTDFHAEGDRGFYAKVQGAEFSIGNEVFLVERGVHIQSSEVSGAMYDNSEQIYVALEREIIARIEVAPKLYGDGKRLVKELAKQKVNVELYGEHVSNSIVERTGMMVSPKGNPSDAVSQQEAYFLRSKTEPKPWQERGGVVMSAFNPLTWDLHAADMTFLGNDLLLISKLVKSSHRWSFVQKLNVYLTFVLTFALLFSATLSITTPIVTAAIAVVGSFFITLASEKIS